MKTILITGASRGIGLALTRHFLNAGYRVIGTSRSGEIKELNHPNLSVVALDLSKETSIKQFAEQIKLIGGSIDILINNAGIGPDLGTVIPESTSFHDTFAVNVSGTVFLTEALLPLMAPGGKIIHISSSMGSVEGCAGTDAVAYRMSKAALNMYSKILANRLSGKQLVAALHPGWVRTTISGTLSGRLTPEESALKIADFIQANTKTGVFWDIERQSEIDW